MHPGRQDVCASARLRVTNVAAIQTAEVSIFDASVAHFLATSRQKATNTGVYSALCYVCAAWQAAPTGHRVLPLSLNRRNACHQLVSSQNNRMKVVHHWPYP